MIPALVIAGVGSGVGKTTVTLGLLETLRPSLVSQVQPFKVGPDFIDPGFHALVAGASFLQPGRLDVLARARARHRGAARGGRRSRARRGRDGLFRRPGRARVTEGSTARSPKWLGAPVVLVADAWAMARAPGAVVLGFESFDPELDLAGVVFNRVAGDTHWRWLREAVDGALPDASRSATCRAGSRSRFPSGISGS